MPDAVASPGRPAALFVDCSPRIGGAARVLFTLVDAVDRDRVEPVVVCHRGGTVEEEVRRRGWSCEALDLPPLTFDVGARSAAALAGKFARATWALRRILRARRPLFVHANGLAAALYAGLPARSAGVAMLWHVHDLLPLLTRNRPFVRYAAATASRIVAVSAAARDRLLAFGVPGRKCRIVYNGPVAPLAPTSPAAEEPRGAFSLLALGTITPHKGHQHLIEAMPAVLRAHPDAVLAIAGEVMLSRDLPHLDALRSRAAALKVEHAVRFLGFRPDSRTLIERSSIVVHPSESEESFGLVPLEAMVEGKPVVATRVGAIPEVVDDGVSGLLIAPGDRAALADAINRLLGDEDLRARLGREGRRIASEKFSRVRMLRGLDSVIEEMAGTSILASRLREMAADVE